MLGSLRLIVYSWRQKAMKFEHFVVDFMAFLLTQPQRLTREGLTCVARPEFQRS